MNDQRAGVLSEAEVAAYRRDGFLVPRFRLEGSRLAQLQHLADRLLDDNPGRGDEPMVCPHVPGSGVQGIRGDRAWLDVSVDADILDMVEHASHLTHLAAQLGEVKVLSRDQVDRLMESRKKMGLPGKNTICDDCAARHACSNPLHPVGGAS